jgi:hypothetical protein
MKEEKRKESDSKWAELTTPLWSTYGGVLREYSIMGNSCEYVVWGLFYRLPDVISGLCG